MKIPVADLYNQTKIREGSKRRAARMSDILGAAWEMTYVTGCKVSPRVSESKAFSESY